MPRLQQQINLVFGTSPLLLAVLVPYIMIAAFWIERHSIREAMEKKMQETHLVQLQLAEGSYTWVKPGKEIRFNNRLFDVKSFTTQKDSVVFLGLFDEVEKALLLTFENLQQKTHKESRSQLAVTLFHIIGLAQPAPQSFACKFASPIVAKQWNIYPASFLQPGHESLPDQPPCNWFFSA